MYDIYELWQWIVEHPVISGIVLTLAIFTVCFTGYTSKKIKNIYLHYLDVETTSGLTGKEAAEKLLIANGLTHVRVESIRGLLQDHYDAQEKVVRLSNHNYERSSLAGVAVAAHEIGHAIQDVENYKPFKMRTKVANFLSFLFRFKIQWVLVVLGFVMLFASMGVDGVSLVYVSMGMIIIGFLLPVLNVLFPIVTLVVEVDASRRAMAQLTDLNLIRENETPSVKKVLDAAGWTYVANLIESIWNVFDR